MKNNECCFGNSFKQEMSNLNGGAKLLMPQTIKNPKPAPVAKNTTKGSPKKMSFNQTLPKASY